MNIKREHQSKTGIRKKHSNYSVLTTVGGYQNIIYHTFSLSFFIEQDDYSSMQLWLNPLTETGN